MQNIVTLGEINDALKIAAVSAAQLADMGFAALANKPICEGLPPEESRRLRNAKLYPAESIGQIRAALAQRFSAPALEQAPESGQSRFHGQPWMPCSAEHVTMVLAAPHEWKGYEVRYLYAASVQAVPAEVTALFEALDSMVDVCEGHDFDGAPSDAHMEKARSAISAYRAALAATPAALEVPAEGDPASLLQLADLLESGRHLIHVERKEVANALRTLAATPAADAPARLVESSEVVSDSGGIKVTRLNLSKEGRHGLMCLASEIPAAAAPVVLSEPVSDKDIDAAVYTQCPDFDAAHEGPSIDDMRAIVRALLATATGLPAQAVALKLIEAINTACGGNEWQGDALATDLLEPACRAISSLAPRAQEDARLRLVRQAVRDFHYALDNRKHGGVAAGAAMNAIELALNMYWQQGQEADRRANQATQGGE
ncbi:hypothetical protein ACJJWD_09375 [Comamonas testosteroni]|uniref:hypothetical protein n=1 Tax=Comamonas testosteroni TaxID=285 RepID=UPI00389AC21C